MVLIFDSCVDTLMFHLQCTTAITTTFRSLFPAVLSSQLSLFLSLAFHNIIYGFDGVFLTLSGGGEKKRRRKVALTQMEFPKFSDNAVKFWMLFIISSCWYEMHSALLTFHSTVWCISFPHTDDSPNFPFQFKFYGRNKEKSFFFSHASRTMH